MPRQLPTDPRFGSLAERTVWDALVPRLADTDLLIAGQRVTDHLKDHEIDIVAAVDGAGIVCIEVKGGEVWHDGRGWRQMRGAKQYDIEPVRQARDACYALRDFVEHDPRWTQGRLRCVVPPRSWRVSLCCFRRGFSFPDLVVDG